MRRVYVTSRLTSVSNRPRTPSTLFGNILCVRASRKRNVSDLAPDEFIVLEQRVS
jgi:hypothetical protein